MNRIFLLLACMAMLTTAQAQKFTIEQMAVAWNDISASQYRVNDLNGLPCALVRVQLATPGATFAGNVIGTPQFKEGEYWVYVTAGTKELEVKHKSFVPCHVTFSNYGIQPLQGLTTYVLTLLMPQGATAPVQTQKLTINYSPPTAMVLVDSKPYQGNGTIVLDLPVGSHEYQIAAVGYVTAEGSVKLTSNGARTINETLTANAVVQHQTQQVQSVAIEQPAQDPAVETFTVKGVSFNMIRVDGGTFMMGATKEQAKDLGKYVSDSEKPVHQVTLSTYSIGETEVTQALWQAVMGSNPSEFKGDNLPVENVFWKECQEFISKLNELTGKHFRLPTEAEWEYAARGGSKSRNYKYSGSNNIRDVAWFWKNSGDSPLHGVWDPDKMLKKNCKTHHVKTKLPNELGLYDMSGNVSELCQDWYGPYSSSPQSNPTGASSGSERVVRGGNWFVVDWHCLSSFRSGWVLPGSIGLRLAL